MGRYFDSLYATVGTSPSHAALSREALGNGYVGQLGYASEDDLQRLAERVRARPGTRILDLCCGTAGVADWVGRVTGAEVVGIDCSAVGLRLARSHRAGPAALALGDVSRLPFADGSFDGISCLDGFSYTPGAMAWEAIRVLRPGGRLAFLVSLPGEGTLGMARSLREVGFTDVQFEDRSETAEPLMAAWLAAFERRAAIPYRRGWRALPPLPDRRNQPATQGLPLWGAVRVLINAERPRVTGAA